MRSYARRDTVVFGHGSRSSSSRAGAANSRHDLIITSGQRVAGNVVPLVFHIHEATYLAGMMAGGLTRSGKIGFIGGMELPPIRLGYNGWVAGARAVRADVETRLTWLNTFDDAAAGKEAALALIRLGVDQLHHNADAAALGLFAAAKEHPGVMVYGANADQVALAPSNVVGSAVIDLPRALLLVAREVKSGTFVPAIKNFGLTSEVIRWEPSTALTTPPPAELVKRVNASRDSIIAGTLVVRADETAQ